MRHDHRKFFLSKLPSKLPSKPPFESVSWSSGLRSGFDKILLKLFAQNHRENMVILAVVGSARASV